MAYHYFEFPEHLFTIIKYSKLMRYVNYLSRICYSHIFLWIYLIFDETTTMDISHFLGISLLIYSIA